MAFKNAKRNVVIVMTIIIVSKLIGMVRDVVLANYYGTSNVSDAYLIASTVPTLIFYFIGHALSTAFLPIYNKAKQEKGEDKALKYMNNLLFFSFFVCIFLVSLLVLFPEFVSKIFAAGFDSETINISANMIRISAASLFFMVIINIWSSYLNAKDNFIVPAAISLPRNIIIIVSIILSAKAGIVFLGLGLLFAYVSEFIFLVPSVFKVGYRPKITLNFKDEEMKQTYKMVLPIIIGTGVSQINKIIDRSVASTVIIGGVSALSYASTINTAIQEVLVTSIITILFADCSKLVAQGHDDVVKEKLSKTIDFLSAIIVPAMIGIIVLAEPIVSIVFGRGEFDKLSIKMTGGALRWYTSGLLFLAVRDTIVKVFYAYKDTKITTILSIFSIVLNIGLNFIFVKLWGLNGLAIATVLSVGVNSICLYVILRRKIGDFGTKGSILNLAKSLAASSVMATCVWFFYEFVCAKINGLLALLIAVVVGVLVYFGCAFIFRIDPIIKRLKRRRNGGKI